MQLLSKVLRMRPVLGLLAAAALLGLAEGALRVLPLAQALRPDWTPGGLVDHAVFWAPLGETDNPLGVARYWQPLRGAHPDQAPASGVTRVVCLGGSSTYGWPFEDAAVAYPARVQRRLGPRFDVLNAGEGGFTSFQALLYLESRLVHYKPAVVTFCFGANDGNDNSEIGTCMTDEEYWTWLSARAAGGGAWRLAEMARSLRLYVLVQRGVHSLRVALLPYLCTPRARVPVAAFEVNLLRFAALGKEQGFRPVLVSEAHRAPEARRDYREAMARAAARAGVAFVDAHAQLPSDPKERAALFIDEVHLTEQGHERVAEILARELAGTGPR